MPSDAENAALWWVMRKTNAQQWTDRDESALQAWLVASEQNLSAHAEALRASELMAEKSTYDAVELESLLREEPKVIAPWSRIAAPLAAAAAIAIVFTLWYTIDFGEEYITEVSKRDAMILADGTTVEMDASSRLKWFDSETDRRVVLLAGAAVFDIAAGDPRPFSVEVGDTIIKDIGTRFSVSLREGLAGTDSPVESVEIEVEEGIVDVYRKTEDISEAIRLTAGEQTVYPIIESIEQPEVEALAEDEFATWRENRFHYRNRPLTEVLADLQRYYSGKVVLRDSDLAQVTVSGTLHTDRLQEAVGILERILPLRVVEFSEDRIVLDSVK